LIKDSFRALCRSGEVGTVVGSLSSDAMDDRLERYLEVLEEEKQCN
jgi:hypothetical protein